MNPTPAEADPIGDHYCFERGARKDTGGKGWADVWKRHHFAWEYKGKHKNLDAAFNQLRQYALALENPPLLIVSDMARFRIRTNWTNSVSETHEFTLDDLADAANSAHMLKWAMSEPERLRPGERARQTAHRTRSHHFCRPWRRRYGSAATTSHVGCAFREPAGVLHVRRRRGAATKRHVHPDAGTQRGSKPEEFCRAMHRDLFGAMSTGGRMSASSRWSGSTADCSTTTRPCR